MKYNLSIEVNRLNLKATSINISKNNINIEDEVILDINKDEVSNKAFDDLIKFINKSNKKYRYINYNIQTEDIIIRNIKDINVKNKKETLGQIRYEIIKYFPIDIDDYEIKYKILNKQNEIASIQVILFPKYLINLCKHISKTLKIKLKSINVNFDNIQKLIEQKLIKNLEENTVILEIKDNEILLNKVVKNKILESYIVPKNLNITTHINSFDEDIKDIYVYGNEKYNIEDFIKFGNLNIKKVILDITKQKITISSKLNQDINKYINTIGVVVQVENEKI